LFSWRGKKRKTVRLYRRRGKKETKEALPTREGARRKGGNDRVRAGGEPVRSRKKRS